MAELSNHTSRTAQIWRSLDDALVLQQRAGGRVPNYRASAAENRRLAASDLASVGQAWQKLTRGENVRGVGSNPGTAGEHAQNAVLFGGAAVFGAVSAVINGAQSAAHGIGARIQPPATQEDFEASVQFWLQARFSGHTTLDRLEPTTADEAGLPERIEDPDTKGVVPPKAVQYAIADYGSPAPGGGRERATVGVALDRRDGRVLAHGEDLALR